MKNSVSLLRSANRVLLLQHSFKRQFIQSRRYVNWTPDKPSKKKNGKIIPPTQLNPTGSPPQSPVEPNKVFHPSPPTSQSEHVTTTESEPQLIRLKNKKTFNQWEKEWNERVWRVGQATLIVGILIAGYAIGAGYVHLPYGMNYRPSKLPQEGTDEEMEYLNRVKNALHSLSIVQRLSEDKDWIKTIGIFATPKEDIPHHLTNGVLAGTGKITVKPVTFWNNKTKEFVVVMHVGQDVCGHRGLVHGGFLATMLDECMGKTVLCSFIFKANLRPLLLCPKSMTQMARKDRFGPKIELLSLQI